MYDALCWRDHDGGGHLREKKLTIVRLYKFSYVEQALQ